MSKGETGGILIIAVERGNEIDIEYSKKEIENKINSFFGYKLIKEIRFSSFNKKMSIGKKKKLNNFSNLLEKKINEIENKDIKNSLSQLFNAIKND